MQASSTTANRRLENSVARKRIVYFDHTSLMSGGEVALLNLISSLKPEKYEPIVVLCQDGPFADNLRSNNIETHIFPLSMDVLNTRKDSLGISSLSRFGKAFELLTYSTKLAVLLRKLDAQMLHTNSLKSDIIGAVAGRLARVPVIWHVRDRIADDYLPTRVASAFRWLCTFLPSHVITISNATYETLQTGNSGRIGKSERITIVHDGVNKQAFSDYASRDWTSQDSVRIGIVGRLSPWKGQHVFIKAAALLRKDFPNAIFQIIGSAMFDETEYADHLVELVRENNLEKNVLFFGFRTDVATLIQNLDIVVHASTIGEPFGQVIVEGMAAGKPVIATNGGAVPEIIEDGKSGLLVPPGDENALAEALRSLLQNPDHAQLLGAVGKMRARDHFSIEKTARGVEKIYEQLLK